MNFSALRAAAIIAATAFPSLSWAQNAPSPQEAVFVPLLPCRIYKSVTANSNTPLPANNYATINVAGTGNFTSQGGPDGGCGVPSSATAVAVSVTTSHATSTGTLDAFIYGNSSQTPGTAITFTPSYSLTTGLAIGLASGAFQVQPIGGSTNVTVDVTGYYAPQIEGYVRSDGTLYSKTTRIVSASHTGTGTYAITTDTNVNFCTAHVTGNGSVAIYLAETSSYNVQVNVYGLSGALADGAFNLLVTC